MNEHYRPRPACLKCGEDLDAASGLDPAERQSPRPGDVMICAYCAHVMLWSVKGYREMTRAEAAEVLADPDIIVARAMITARPK